MDSRAILHACAFVVIFAASLAASVYIHRNLLGCGGKCCQCQTVDRICCQPPRD